MAAFCCSTAIFCWSVCGVHALHLPEARVPLEARPLLLEGVHRPEMVEVLLRDIHVVLETLLVSLGLVLHFLLVLLVLVLEVIREGLLVLQREVVLERLELLLHRVDDRRPTPTW